MAKIETEVLDEFFGRLDEDERISEETVRALRGVLGAGAVPKPDALVTLLELTTGERLA